jgi:hypothetical protein
MRAYSPWHTNNNKPLGKVGYIPMFTPISLLKFVRKTGMCPRSQLFVPVRIMMVLYRTVSGF